MIGTVRTAARVFAPAALLVACGAAASAAGARVIFSEITASSTSDVPGVPGAKWGAFDRPYRCPDGTRWIISGDIAGAPTAANEVVVTGMGLAGALAIQEGIAAPWAPGETINGGILRNLAINDGGQFLFSTNTDGPTASDQYLVRGEPGGTFTVMRQEGQPVTAIGGTALFGATIQVGGLQNDGKAGYRASLTTVPAGFGTTGLFIGDDMVANTANTSLRPTGQMTGGTENWSLLDSEDFYVNSDGSRWGTAGSLTGASTSNVVYALNNTVVLQEGFAVPGGSGGVMSALTESIMTPNGDYWVRGSYATTNVDWIAQNGSVVIETDMPVPGGLPGETFDDAPFSATFFEMTSNNVGDFIYGGTTSNPDLAHNAVLVFNNSDVVCREGDAVDLDGNGMFDDGVFISVFNNDDMFLTDDRYLYFTADLVDVNGSALGQGFLRVQVPTPGAGGALFLAIGALGARRRRF